MRYFKLNCLVVNVNDQVLRKEWDQTYPESKFGKRLADKLLKEGKLVEVNKKGQGSKEPDNTKGSEDQESEETKSVEGAEMKAYEDFQNKDEIKQELDRLGIEYSGNEKKDTLYGYYQKAFE